MKYEIILKVKDRLLSNFYNKWRVIKKDYKETIKDWEKIYHRDYEKEYQDHIILVNKLDDDGNFIETIL